MCYDISGNTVDCTDTSAFYDDSFTPLQTQTLPTDFTASTPTGTPAFGPPVSPDTTSTAAQVGVNADGGNSSGIGAAISSVTKAVGSIFGQVYSTANPAKPGTVINPATGQPYSIGQQLQLSGIFGNPLLLIIIIVAVVMASKHR